MIDYKNKYLKYKNKYLQLKKQNTIYSTGGGVSASCLKGDCKKSTISSTNIHICSYNILTQIFVKNQQLNNKYTEDEIIEYKSSVYRMELVQQHLNNEIRKNSIICLQEVPLKWINPESVDLTNLDENILLTNNLKIFFRNNNYDFFANNYSNEYTGNMGVLIAFPRNIYKMVNKLEIVPINYVKPKPLNTNNDLSLDSITVSSSASDGDFSKKTNQEIETMSQEEKILYNIKLLNYKTWKSLREKKNIMIILQLTDISTGIKFCVGTYHTPCNFRNQKFMQLANLLAAQSIQIFADGLAYIFAGDLNSQPNTPSYNILVGNEIKPNEKLEKETVGDDWDAIMTPPLLSAYFIKNKKEPRATNDGQQISQNPDGSFKVGERFCGTLDYIFLSDDRFKVIDVKELDNIFNEEDGPYPSKDEPSDHVLISANLLLKSS
jgi:hypothetical protein